MIPATPPPPPALVDAVRRDAWVEVRSITSTLAPPLSPAVALVAARAARKSGDAAAAVEIVRAALPRAGELAAALRLEAGEAHLARKKDPWLAVGRLVDRGAPTAQRRAARELLRRAFNELPLPVVQAYRSRTLPRTLRRELDAALAVRAGDQAAAIRLLRATTAGPAAVSVARWLATRPGVSEQGRLLAAEALLTGGWWREADALLATTGKQATPALVTRLLFVRGRVAYRLGRFDDAIQRLDAALAAAPTAAERFAPAVQRARIFELRRDWPAAMEAWAIARTTGPAEIEGWDGEARLLVALGRGEEAVALLLRAPPSVLRTAGPRLAASLLAHREENRAAGLLLRLPSRVPTVRLLTVATELARGDREAAFSQGVELLSDRHAAAWREYVFDIVPDPLEDDASAVPPSRDPRVLAGVALLGGRVAARRAFAAALAADPAWAALLAGAALEPRTLAEPVEALLAVGLQADAARLYPHRFPSGTPQEMAWSAVRLASGGNGPAALAMGERLWAAAGAVPAELLPDALLPYVIPPQLVAGCMRAAAGGAANPGWLAALIRRESRFDATALSQAGAVGVAQIVPETARRLGSEPEELWDGERALGLAAAELSRLGRVFELRLDYAAAAYNAGDAVVHCWIELLSNPTAVLFATGIPYRETASYVAAVREGSALTRYLVGAGGDGVPLPPEATPPSGSTDGNSSGGLK